MPEGERTTFAGLEVLAPGAPLSTDAFAFQVDNPAIIDVLLKLGAVLHRHDEHAGLANPVTKPELVVGAGGGFHDDVTLFVGYTLTDSYGGETMLSGVSEINTGVGFGNPEEAPTAVLDNVAGTLLAGNYTYALTCSDGKGGESLIGPPITVAVQPGFAHSEIVVSKLGAILKVVAKGAVGAQWRLWRIQNAGPWTLMGTGTEAEEIFTDDGSHAPNCNVEPPEENTSVGSHKVTIKVPNPANPAVSFFTVYACLDNTFVSPCRVGTFAIGEVGAPIVLENLAVNTGRPPAVNRSIPGAKKINPDTDLVAFPYKRAVFKASELPTEGNEDGDVRETLEDHQLHFWKASTGEWLTASQVVKKTFRTIHTFSEPSEITVKNIPGFFVSKDANQTTKLLKVIYKIESGGTVKFRIQKNGADIAGFGTAEAPLQAKPETKTDEPGAVALAENDLMSIVISAVESSPAGLTVTVVLEHTI